MWVEMGAEPVSGLTAMHPAPTASPGPEEALSKHWSNRSMQCCPVELTTSAGVGVPFNYCCEMSHLETQFFETMIILLLSLIILRVDWAQLGSFHLVMWLQLGGGWG